MFFGRRISLLSTGVMAFFAISFLATGYSFAAEDRLKTKYEASDLNILIVPGHDDESLSGTEFRGLREADLNLNVANELFALFSADPHFRTFITRGPGGYKPEFREYFLSRRADIQAFREESKKAMNDLLTKGVIQKKVVIHHNSASDEDSLKLYGINKWANEHDIDLVLHVHFNDDPARVPNWTGTYSGFSAYVPEAQLPNHDASLGIASSIVNQLQKYFPVSDAPLEKRGVIEDQELIAIGANASLESAAVLIEYGYIYESPFTHSRVWQSAARELAYQTYLGLGAYFDAAKEGKEIAMLPYEWTSYLKKGLKYSRDVFALQLALTKEGLYPPNGFSRNDCGVTGNFGECTERATIAFQKKHRLPQSGYVGPLTIAKLNETYFYDTPKSAEIFSYAWNKDLYYGMTHDEDVRALQNALLFEGVYRGPISGAFFELTREGVIEFQKKHRFNIAPNTGYVGLHTRAVLNQLYSRQSSAIKESS